MQTETKARGWYLQQTSAEEPLAEEPYSGSGGYSGSDGGSGGGYSGFNGLGLSHSLAALPEMVCRERGLTLMAAVICSLFLSACDCRFIRL